MDLDPYLTSCTKFNLKWILDLNGRCTTIQLPEENIRENFCGLGLGKYILAIMSKAQSINKKIGMLDFITVKTFTL